MNLICKLLLNSLYGMSPIFTSYELGEIGKAPKNTTKIIPLGDNLNAL